MKRMGETDMAYRVLALMSSLRASASIDCDLFRLCFEGVSVNNNAELLEAYCLLGVSFQMTEHGRGLFKHSYIWESLCFQLRLLDTGIFLRVKDCLSRHVLYQESLRSRYFHSTLVDSESREDSLRVWLQDLGAPQWIAFSSEAKWKKWSHIVANMLDISTET